MPATTTYRGRRVVIVREDYALGLTLVASQTAPPPLTAHETAADWPDGWARWVPTGEVIVMVTAEKEPQPA